VTLRLRKTFTQQEIKGSARCQWLMPITLAPWKVEIKRVAVRSQPRLSSRQFWGEKPEVEICDLNDI
jgi:hypothetical protein